MGRLPKQEFVTTSLNWSQIVTGSTSSHTMGRFCGNLKLHKKKAKFEQIDENLIKNPKNQYKLYNCQLFSENKILSLRQKM